MQLLHVIVDQRRVDADRHTDVHPNVDTCSDVDGTQSKVKVFRNGQIVEEDERTEAGEVERTGRISKSVFGTLILAKQTIQMSTDSRDEAKVGRGSGLENGGDLLALKADVGADRSVRRLHHVILMHALHVAEKTDGGGWQGDEKKVGDGQMLRAEQCTLHMNDKGGECEVKT